MGIEDQCTPSVVYLVIIVIMVIGITGYNYYKGHGISYSGIISQVLSTFCCMCIINLLCGWNEIFAWIFLILPVVSAIGALTRTANSNDFITRMTGGLL
jgi:hypothetical protein